MFKFRVGQIEITMRYFSAIRLAKIYCESVSSARKDVGKWVHLFKSKGNMNCLRFFGVHSRNSHDNVKLHKLFDVALSPLEMQLTLSPGNATHQKYIYGCHTNVHCDKTLDAIKKQIDG